VYGLRVSCALAPAVGRLGLGPTGCEEDVGVEEGKRPEEEGLVVDLLPAPVPPLSLPLSPLVLSTPPLFPSSLPAGLRGGNGGSAGCSPGSAATHGIGHPIGGSARGVSRSSIARLKVQSGGMGESLLRAGPRRAKRPRNWECRSMRGVGGREGGMAGVGSVGGLAGALGSLVVEVVVGLAVLEVSTGGEKAKVVRCSEGGMIGKFSVEKT